MLFRSTNKAILKIIKGESLESALESEELIDLSVTPGIVYLGIPAKDFEQGENFHPLPFGFYLHEKYLDKQLSSEREEEIYQHVNSLEVGCLNAKNSRYLCNLY